MRCSSSGSSRPEADIRVRKADSCSSVTSGEGTYSVRPAPTAQAVLGMIRRMGQESPAISLKRWRVRPAAMDTSTKPSCRRDRMGRSRASRSAIIWGLTPRKM